MPLATALPVVFLVCAVLFGAFVASGNAAERPHAPVILGGPVNLGPANAAFEGTILLGADDGEPAFGSIDPDPDALRGAVVASAATASVTADGVTLYRVQRGDTLSTIAKYFKVSANTIIWANPSIRGRALRLGEELVVLPVTGVLHTVQDEQTVQAVADLYGISSRDILIANVSLTAGAISPGTHIVIPGGKPIGTAISDKTLPNLDSTFVIPTEGLNWGELHDRNAVDIANACGTAIVASAEGLVTTAEASGWNDGYGTYIEIEHPNGTATLYAHLSKLEVSIGDYVRQNQEIAKMGNTGNVHGPTGCHLHFEVHGARNPYAKR